MKQIIDEDFSFPRLCEIPWKMQTIAEIAHLFCAECAKFWFIIVTHN